MSLNFWAIARKRIYNILLEECLQNLSCLLYQFQVLRLSRISLTNLTHFLSRSSNLRSFKVTNIGRRERPRWTDERIKQILPPDSVPMLQVVLLSLFHQLVFLKSKFLRYTNPRISHQYSFLGFSRILPAQRRIINGRIPSLSSSN